MQIGKDYEDKVGVKVGWGEVEIGRDGEEGVEVKDVWIKVGCGNGRI